MNSRPLTSLNKPDDDGLQVLKLGHFLIGITLQALPDMFDSLNSLSLIGRLYICHNVIKNFWKQ